MFDIVDDENDTLEYAEDELNKYYLSGHLNSMEHEDEMIDDDRYHNDLNEIQTEAILSQKFSQLSTKTEDEQKSVMSTLKQSESHLIEVDRRVWPMQIQSLMLAQQKAATTTASTSITEDQQTDCEKHLYQRLIEMNKKIQYHQN
ncbi:unnamed protein product [Rotaria magnacalcarata]|uniref:Uncharacterized protein n=1 Tax=Rotaria magnacalcarata TaxID=392030 RepID=A0A820Q080_9BILA|nr:unnamed protein product [Rotaria magnacalcarata]